MHENMDELVRIVTERVIAAMNSQNSLTEAQTEGKI